MAAADKTDEGTEVCSKHQYSAQRVCRKLGLLHTLRCWIGLLRIAYNPPGRLLLPDGRTNLPNKGVLPLKRVYVSNPEE